MSRRRKYRNRGDLPQLVVQLSARPEFGGKACSRTMAYRACDGEAVSARLQAVLDEARRILKERAA